MPDIDSGIRRASSFPYKKDGKTIALEHKGKPRYGRHRRVDGYFFGARSEGAGTPSQTPTGIAPATSEAVLLPRAASLTADQAFYDPTTALSRTLDGWYVDVQQLRHQMRSRR